MKPPFIISLAVVAVLASCADVTSKQIAGDKPAKLDAKEWNGAWAENKGTPVYARVKDADRGLLEVVSVEVKDDEIKTTRLDVSIREAGGWLWASYREDADRAFTVARVTVADDGIIAWTLQSASIQNRVKAGQLKGEIPKDKEGKESKNVVLEALHDADLQAIKDGKWGEVLDWGKPALQLFRVKD